MELKNYQINLEVKRTIFLKAKNKTDARKKMQERLSKSKGARFVKIDFVEENSFGGYF